MFKNNKFITLLICVAIAVTLCSCKTKTSNTNENKNIDTQNQISENPDDNIDINYEYANITPEYATSADQAYAWKSSENGSFMVTYKNDNSENYYSPLDKDHTWQCNPLPKTDSPASFYKLENVAFYDQNIGTAFVLLDSGMSKSYYDIYLTADSGKTWINIIKCVKTVDMVNHIAFLDKDHIVALCNEGASLAHIIIIDIPNVKSSQYSIMSIFDGMTSSKITSIKNNIINWEYVNQDGKTEKVTTDLTKYIN